MYRYKCLLVVFLIFCTASVPAAADWVDLVSDDRETVRDAITQEVDKRGDFDDAQWVKGARQEAIDEAHRKSQAVVERVDELRLAFMRVKAKRDDQQAELERLTRRKDDAENNYKSAVDLIHRLDAQHKDLQREIDEQGQQLKKQLANEAVGELLTAVVFRREGLRGARLSELESEASRLAGEAAITELLTYIESTSLIEEGVLTRDEIVQRISGRAESEPGKIYREKIASGTYLRLLSFRLKPLQGSLLKAKSGLPAAGMQMAVIRKAEDLPRFLQAQGFNVSGKASAEAERLLEQSKRTTEKDAANVESILRRTREVVKQKHEAIKEIGGERSDAESRRARNKNRMEEAARGMGEVHKRLLETGDAVQDAASLYEQSVAAYRKYKFKQAKGMIGRSERPTDAAIEVILNALQEVRDDARRHYYDSLTKVDGGRFIDERVARKDVAARISRFKLIYLAEAEFTDELEIGVLFETMAARKASLQETPVSPATEEADNLTLTVNTEPADTTVRVLNIKPRYSPGMRLEAGRYHIELSRSGYQTQRHWVELSGQQQVFSFSLSAVGTGPETSAPRQGPEPDMVTLKGGCFEMGSAVHEQGREDRERLHRVCVEGFAMGKHEVSVAEFRRFVEDTGYRTEAQRQGGCSVWRGAWKKDASASWMNPGFDQQPNHPVICVSWNDARAYAEWLSSLSARRYRLPTEAEWEYAARGGTTSSRYWGKGAQEACGFANTADDSFAEAHAVSWHVHDCRDGFVATAPVGQFRPNAFRLQDMLGNVWEWTCSGYDEQYGGGEQRCIGEDASPRRMIRGGAWVSRPARVRSASRHHARSSHRSTSIGFRLVRE
jgi:formylglycine-generating enzyme required for sulfatase activity